MRGWGSGSTGGKEGVRLGLEGGSVVPEGEEREQEGGKMRSQSYSVQLHY